jgi:hypothetical protein
VALKFVLNAVDAALDRGFGFPERVNDPADHGEEADDREQENDPKNPGTNVQHLTDEMLQDSSFMTTNADALFLRANATPGHRAKKDYLHQTPIG